MVVLYFFCPKVAWCSINHRTRPLPVSTNIVVHMEKKYPINPIVQCGFSLYWKFMMGSLTLRCKTIFFHCTSVTGVMLDDKLKNQFGWIHLSNNCCILSADWLPPKVREMAKVREMYPLNSLLSTVGASADISSYLQATRSHTWPTTS